MAPRRPQSPPARPVLNPEQARRVIERLKTRILELEAFDPTTVATRHDSPEVEALEASIQDTLQAAFGAGTVEYHRYSRAASLDNGPITMISGFERGPRREDMPEVFQGYLREGRDRSVALLRQAIKTLEEELGGDAPAPSAPQPSVNRKVFIVHGRNEAPREAVARLLAQLGLEPIILHEKANQGRTVIEKVEEHGNVGFAVVLLTADDEGNLKGEAPQGRARQNVLLELGYFIGRLGRSRVCALISGEIEIPSDWMGVVNETYDANGAWKQVLGRELQAAGYKVDWNMIMG